MIKPEQALVIAGVPQHQRVQALQSLRTAKQAVKGLLTHKLKVRWLRAGMIADALSWSDERLCDVRPDLADHDIAPMINITAHGDNGPWTDEGRHPLSRYWLNDDPASEEYRYAVSRNYWKKGVHPRSKASRKAWYRRNGGEYEAWSRGPVIEPSDGFQIFRGEKGRTRVIAWQASGAWIVMISTRVLGGLCINQRYGYEIDNIYCGDYFPQGWFAAPGYALRAPVTWSVLPGGWLDMSKKRWELQREQGML